MTKHDPAPRITPEKEEILGRLMAAHAKADRKKRPALVAPSNLPRENGASVKWSDARKRRMIDMFTLVRGSLNEQFTVGELATMTGRTTQQASGLIGSWSKLGLVTKAGARAGNRKPNQNSGTNYVTLWRVVDKP